MDRTEVFEQERPRLLRIAERVVGDRTEAEDLVQQTWLRLHRQLERSDGEAIDNLPGWLTTVTTRLCLDRLRSRAPAPGADADVAQLEPSDRDALALDPAEQVALADTVGIALQVVLDRLTPGERVAFVLHDSFAVDFPTIAAVLGTTPIAARKLASRARHKVAQPSTEDGRADWQVVDAFLSAARGGDLGRLLDLLAPDVVVVGDADAVDTGTPARIDGRDAVAAMFNGAARSALATFSDGRPGAAWYLHGEAKVAFDFTVQDGRISHITFRAAPAVLAALTRRRGADPA